MTIRSKPLLPLTRLSALIACFCLSHSLALAQTDVQDPLQIDPPVVPRHRRARPAFQVSVDPTAKPLPAPTFIQEPPLPAPVAAAKPPPPTPEQIAKGEAQLKQRQRKETTDQIQKDHYLDIAKVGGIVLVVGVGIFSVFDIVRQIRKAKQVAARREKEEEEDWEP